jgi:hypothetical protein
MGSTGPMRSTIVRSRCRTRHLARLAGGGASLDVVASLARSSLWNPMTQRALKFTHTNSRGWRGTRWYRADVLSGVATLESQMAGGWRKSGGAHGSHL